MSSSASKINHLHLKVHPSRYLSKLLLLQYSGALLLLWLTPMMIWVKLPLSLLLIFGCGWYWCRVAAQTHSKSWQQLTWYGEGDWSLWRKNGEHLAHLKLVQSVNHPLLVVLNFSGGHHLVLLPDSSDADSLRKLRVRLKLGDGSP